VLSGATGIPVDVWSRALAKDPFQVQRIDDVVTRSQQAVADRFRALGLVPIDVKISDIVWRASV
jgi:sulfonate transport system substrate-binding protein